MEEGSLEFQRTLCEVRFGRGKETHKGHRTSEKGRRKDDGIPLAIMIKLMETMRPIEGGGWGCNIYTCLSRNKSHGSHKGRTRVPVGGFFLEDVDI